MRRPPAAVLAAAPITVLCLATLPILTWWAADGAGYAVGAWSPGLLVLLLLLGLAALIVPNTWHDLPRAVLVGAALLTVFTYWSYLSVAWADDPGAAIEGANRTLLYLVVFCLFALWPQAQAGAAAWVVAWVLAVSAVAAVTAVRLLLSDDPGGLFVDGRLATPVGYPNAAAATFAMALWPAILLASTRRLHPGLRAACAGGAVLLAALTLMTQSRGALLAVPVTGFVCLLLAPGRLRTFAALFAVAAGTAACAPAVLDIADALDGRTAGGAIDGAARAALLAAAIVAVVVGLVAAWERSRLVQADGPGLVLPAPAVRLLAVGAALVVVGGAVALHPVDRLDRAWTSFKGDYSQNDPAASSRLVGGLGSNRYDFYRVAVEQFRRAPLVGAGADNFQQDYLVDGRSGETPRYPHSVQLRTLGQVGLVGTLLLLGAVAAALWAGLRGVRARPSRHAPGPAVSALVGTLYVGVHGSADWFWEVAGIGAPAFALLGLAAGLAPRAPGGHERTARRPLAIGGLCFVLAAAAVAVGGPWLSSREVARAAEVFVDRPGEAYARLADAAVLDPFSDRPRLVEGSLALRRGELDRADGAFVRALRRVPRGQYATLQRGALAASRGDLASAEPLLERAVALAPRDPIAREALDVVRDGGRINLIELQRRILDAAEAFGN